MNLNLSRKKIVSKTLFLFTALVLTVSFTVSCASEPLRPDKKTSQKMGSVDGFDVYYDEIWFLSANYRDTVGDLTRDRLNELIREKLPADYAVLSLAREAGIAYSTEDKELKKEVQEQIDSVIEDEYAGKRSDYKKGIEKLHLTDRYFRFLTMVDLVYDDLRTYYLSSGAIHADEQSVKEAYDVNLFRTVHVMTYTEEDAVSVKEALDGGKTMYEMIGSSYNKDFSLTTLDGTYFFPGSMTEEYEEAVKDLSFGEISGIVQSYATDSLGNSRKCYYVIERLEPEDGYFSDFFERLQDEYVNLKLNEMVESYAAGIHFEPTDAYLSLDLFEMTPAKETDGTFLLRFGLPIAAVLAIIAMIAVTLCVKSVRRTKRLEEKYGKK